MIWPFRCHKWEQQASLCIEVETSMPLFGKKFDSTGVVTVEKCACGKNRAWLHGLECKKRLHPDFALGVIAKARDTTRGGTGTA